MEVEVAEGTDNCFSFPASGRDVGARKVQARP